MHGSRPSRLERRPGRRVRTQWRTVALVGRSRTVCSRARVGGEPSIAVRRGGADFSSLTGYDRVMIYRFDEEGHGEVFAETQKAGPRGLSRQPVSRVGHSPDRAPALRAQSRAAAGGRRLQAIAARSPRCRPCRAVDLDMSLCFLRSVSPIHIQYLKNMGVAATLVVSLMVNGKLWGLISCHHYSPRFLNLEMRSVCELSGRGGRNPNRGAGKLRAEARANCRRAGSSSA